MPLGSSLIVWESQARGMLPHILILLFNYCVELKREATARSEIRDKVKEEQSASVAEDKGLAEQTHSVTPSQTVHHTGNIKQEQ